MSPEQSLQLHAGDTTVPVQLLVRALKAGNMKTDFPHRTSIFETRATFAREDALIVKDGLRLFSMEEALILVPENFFKKNATHARTILAIMPDASALLARLLEGGHTSSAGRLAGAFRAVLTSDTRQMCYCISQPSPSLATPGASRYGAFCWMK